MQALYGVAAFARLKELINRALQLSSFYCVRIACAARLSDTCASFAQWRPALFRQNIHSLKYIPTIPANFHQNKYRPFSALLATSDILIFAVSAYRLMH